MEEQNQNELIKALIKAKQKFEPIVKDKNNSHYNAKYASLDSVLASVQPALCSEGLAIIQTIEMQEGKLILLTELIHESGQSRSSLYPLPDNADSAKFASALTRGRRYTVCALLSVSADEDTDNSGSSTPSNGTHMISASYGGVQPKQPKPSDQVSRIKKEMSRLNLTRDEVLELIATHRLPDVKDMTLDEGDALVQLMEASAKIKKESS
ncbi:MAG TPA: ERF family protein [Coleofasciculaceae cyanobacterium]